jgi:AcrR family transcriptional regulator
MAMGAAMASRRMGRPDASIRFALLDATERVLARDGYPAVTSRNVGREAGVDQKLVFYYFQNMEELVVATFRRRSEAFLGELEKLGEAPSPVATLWAMSSHRSGRLMIEFMAMATRNEALRDEVARYSARANEIIDAVLAEALDPAWLEQGKVTPALVNFAIASMARNLILEDALGVLGSPDELGRSIEQALQQLEIHSTKES